MYNSREVNSREFGRFFPIYLRSQVDQLHLKVSLHVSVQLLGEFLLLKLIIDIFQRFDKFIIFYQVVKYLHLDLPFHLSRGLHRFFDEIDDGEAVFGDRPLADFHCNLERDSLHFAVLSKQNRDSFYNFLIYL